MRIRKQLLLVAFLTACNAAQVAYLSGGDAYRLPTTSMEPTIARHEWVIGQKLSSAQQITRGDIVIYRYPVKPDVKMIKRVVALPGETVQVRKKQLLVNGGSVNDEHAVYRDPRIFDDPLVREPFRSETTSARLRLEQMNTFCLVTIATNRSTPDFMDQQSEVP